MYTKECPYCGGSSYSASDCGEWICPYCDKDLSLVIGRPAGADRNEGHGHIKLLNQKKVKKGLNADIYQVKGKKICTKTKFWY